MTAVFSTAVPLIGIALCAMALLQLALWSSQSLSLLSQNRKQFDLSRELLRKQISRATPKTHESATSRGNWKGFRSFLVAGIDRESSNCVSVYLKPEDGKPICTFQPGQHLTLRIQANGSTKPMIRCYTLSDRPGLEHYRVTVKAEQQSNDPANKNSPSASRFINASLKVGDRVEAKAPAGRFVLDESSTEPMVMLAGGIGITPMISMVNHLVALESDRQGLLVYGVRNSSEHPFKNHLDSLASNHANLHLLNFYSAPAPGDKEGADYHASGHVSIEMLKRALPNHACQFYLCGPPPFMESIYQGLIDWGVPREKIFHESFGPASIGHRQPRAPTQPGQLRSPVTFAKSKTNVAWDDSSESLLRLAEKNDVDIDSGCCSGNCGTCATTIISGKVDYPNQEPVDCEPGKCLVCIAQPQGPLVLDA